jgi:1-deoxy-D-xylulose-5-phosphate reductoisomerase
MTTKDHQRGIDLTGVVVLGATGSVGETTLRVLERHSDRFRVVGLAAGKRVKRLAEQIAKWRPLAVSVAREEDAAFLRREFKGVDVYSGPDGPVRLAEHPQAGTVVAAIVGSQGLRSTFRAVELGRRVALANKETLVMAGRLVFEAARRSGAELLPVDSEHCAIFQCLQGENSASVRRLILTASGGALRDFPVEAIPNATVEQVLCHPTWKMGRKITVDSATMMNKGLEIIEAHHLFHVPLGRIEVLLHPQSVVHSMVEFNDGSLIAQMASPDMALPVQFALTYPERISGLLAPLDLAKAPPMTFAEASAGRYPCLALAREAASSSESHAIALNAANEVAVQAFLDGRLRFGDIATLVRSVLDETEPSAPANLEEVLQLDLAARRQAQRRLSQIEE